MINLLQMGKDIAYHGQVLIYLILMCSVISAAIIIDRLISFHKASINLEKFMRKLSPILKRDKIIDAISLCDKYQSIIARTIKAGILKHDRGKTKIKEVMEERSKLEILHLERYLSTLATIAYTAPLLGFLGTVLGMIELFARIQNTAGLLGPGDLAVGMGEALFTTAAGLVVAIPSILAHSYFINRIDGLKADVEQTASELASTFDADM